jgi:hypothetical protein
MLRDVLLVTGALAVLAITCMIAFDYDHSPVIMKGPPAAVFSRSTADFDPKKPGDPQTGPRQPEVLLFTELTAYAEWYLSRKDDRGFDLQQPESVNFFNNQVVAILWGDKPTGGFEIALKSVTDDETGTIVTVATKVPHGPIDPTPSSPGLAVSVPRKKVVRIAITGERFPEKNGFADFKESQSLECEVTIRPNR